MSRKDLYLSQLILSNWLVTSNIKNCVCVCSLKHEKNIYQRSSQNTVSFQDDCLDLKCKPLCFSPYMRKPVLFFLHHTYIERWNKEALCATLRHLCNDKAALEKNLNQVEHRAASGTQKEDRTHLFPELWSTSRMSRGASLPKKSYVSDLCSNVCLFVKLISLLMKSKQRAWLTALCHKFSKVKSA